LRVAIEEMSQDYINALVRQQASAFLSDVLSNG